MLKIIADCLDIIFPARETELLIRNFKNDTDLYSIGNYYRCIFLSDYQNPVIHALIIENKYHHNPEATAQLAKLLDTYIGTITNQTLLIPIPLSTQRLKDRGYNQVTEILNKSASKQISTKILTRTRDTRAQTDLNRLARTKNVSGAFACTKPELLKNIVDTSIILVDDVVTTGSTLNEARAQLQPYLHPTSQLICVALAH